MMKRFKSFFGFLKTGESRSRGSSFMADNTVGSSEEAIASLRQFGYAFNDSGKLCKIDPATGEPGSEPYEFKISEDHAKNEKHYNELARQIPGIVYELLEKEGLKRTYIPFGAHPEKSTFVFTQPKQLYKSKKLIVLIHGSGYVLAGQWARRLIINNSLDHGTQLPYIKRAQKLGYDILVTNTNDTKRIVKGKEHDIKGLYSSQLHANYVFEHIIIPSEPESVAIVAHSFGATVVRDLAEKFPDFFKEKVFAIALTDGYVGNPPNSCKEYFINVTRNWVTSLDPIDTEKTEGPKNQSIPSFSAGHPLHEWSSYSAIESVFTFFEGKYEERVRDQETP